MTQWIQFIQWQIRDFGRMFKCITFNRVIVLLLGAQFGSILVSLSHHDQARLDILSVTIPLTMFLFVLGLYFEMQWNRFKREQTQLIETLKK